MKNNKTFGFFLVSLLIMAIGGTNAEAQNIASQDIQLKSRKFKRDKLGTKTKNVFSFNVDFKEKERTDDSSYVIVLYLNDKPITQFEKVNIPYTFDWSFRAMHSGVYKVKIDIEDLQGNLLATQETSVNVKP